MGKYLGYSKWKTHNIDTYTAIYRKEAGNNNGSLIDLWSKLYLGNIFSFLSAFSNFTTMNTINFCHKIPKEKKQTLTGSFKSPH